MAGQKEFFHDKPLTLSDLALQAAVAVAATSGAAGGAGNGHAWIVGATPGAPGAGRADRIPMWTQSGWRFAAPL